MPRKTSQVFTGANKPKIKELISVKQIRTKSEPMRFLAIKLLHSKLLKEKDFKKDTNNTTRNYSHGASP
jgi:hypothetical protein